MYFLFVASGIAQSDAVIIGKVDSPQSRVVRFEYKRNHFSLEEGSFEATLDTNNTFAIRVKLKESRALFLTHRENAVKLFIAPGDTLKMRFTGGKMAETLTFDGTSGLHNAYLIKTQQAFPDWLNENTLVNARVQKGSKAYLSFIDSLYTEKRRFFDTYSATLKDNFTNDFLDFATNDIDYWRAYQLMLYVKTYGLNNIEPSRVINDNYFNFTLETDNINYKALNNEYYLQYLELYLGYLGEKTGLGQKEPMEIVEEKSRYVKTIKPKNRNVRVIEEPFLPKEVVSWLAPNEEATYQNLLTGEKFKYVGEDSTYEDIFLKVKTSDGKTGWVPQSAISIYEKTVIDRKVRNRFCFMPDEPLCGFDKHLSGKVLYFTVAKDILYSCVYDKFDAIDTRIKKFVDKNVTHREYNNTLNEARALAAKDRDNGYNRLNIPPSLEIEDYWNDRVYYARTLTKLGKDNSANVAIVDYTPPTSNGNTQNTSQLRTFVRAKSDGKTATSNSNTDTKPVEAKTDPTPIVSSPIPADAAKAAEDKKVADEAKAAEDKKVADAAKAAEDKKVADAAKAAEDKKVADAAKAAEDKKVADAAKAAEDKKVADAAKAAEDKKVADAAKAAEDKKVADAAKVAEDKNTADAAKAAEDKKIADAAKAAEDKKIADAAKVAEDKKIADAAKAAEDKKIADAAKAAEDKKIADAAKIKDKPEEAPKPTSPAVIPPTVTYTPAEASGIVFTIPADFMPFPSGKSKDYDPTGKKVEFKGLVVNEAITPFEFTGPDGTTVIRQQELLGKVVVLDFWATWCGPCKPTLEHTQRLAAKYDEKDVVFVYISADTNLDTWKEFLKEHPMKGLHGMDDNALIRINMRVPGVPNYFVIDKKGRVAYNSLIQAKYTAEEMIETLVKQ